MVRRSARLSPSRSAANSSKKAAILSGSTGSVVKAVDQWNANQQSALLCRTTAIRPAPERYRRNPILMPVRRDAFQITDRKDPLSPMSFSNPPVAGIGLHGCFNTGGQNIDGLKQFPGVFQCRFAAAEGHPSVCAEKSARCRGIYSSTDTCQTRVLECRVAPDGCAIMVRTRSTAFTRNGPSFIGFGDRAMRAGGLSEAGALIEICRRPECFRIPAPAAVKSHPLINFFHKHVPVRW